MTDILDQSAREHLGDAKCVTTSENHSCLLPSGAKPESRSPEPSIGTDDSDTNDDPSTGYDSQLEADTWKESLTRIDDEDWEIADRGTKIFLAHRPSHRLDFTTPSRFYKVIQPPTPEYRSANWPNYRVSPFQKSQCVHDPDPRNESSRGAAA